MDYTLKFTSKAAAEKALFDVETSMVDGVEQTILRPKYTAIDVIGTIYKPTFEVSGYHVNVRHNETAPELDVFVVKVNSPERVWAD